MNPHNQQHADSNSFMPLGLLLTIDEELIEAIQKVNENQASPPPPLQLSDNHHQHQHNHLYHANSPGVPALNEWSPHTNPDQLFHSTSPGENTPENLIMGYLSQPPTTTSRATPTFYDETQQGRVMNFPQQNSVSPPATITTVQTTAQPHSSTVRFTASRTSSSSNEVLKTQQQRQSMSPTREIHMNQSGTNPPTTSTTTNVNGSASSSSFTFVTYNPEEKHDKNKKVLVPYINTHPKKSKNDHEHLMHSFKFK